MLLLMLSNDTFDVLPHGQSIQSVEIEKLVHCLLFMYIVLKLTYEFMLLLRIY